jgi:SpoIID/LytB domain protein
MAAAAAVGLLAGLVGHARPDRSMLLVGIARGKQQIRLTANGPFAILEPARDRSHYWEGSQIVTLEWARGTIIQSESVGLVPGHAAHAAPVALITESGERQEVIAPLHVFPRGSAVLKYLDSRPENAASYRGDFYVLVEPAGMTLINVVDMEDYLRGVVPCEMSKHYPAEALKAQAVAARSYALGSGARHQALGFDLCDAEHCQVYGGTSSENPATDQAIEQTRGEVLTCNGRIIAAPYSAVCGGITEASPGRNSCLRSQKDFDPADEIKMRLPADEAGWREYFRQAPAANCCQPKLCPLDRFRWVEVRRRDELEQSLADVVNVGTLLSLRPLERGPSGRITRLEVLGTRGKSVLSPESVIRKALGGLKSSAFVVDAYAEGDAPPLVFVFWGAGTGHGAGMCQVGAAGQAAKGKNYREILKWYFPDCALERRY